MKSLTHNLGFSLVGILFFATANPVLAEPRVTISKESGDMEDVQRYSMDKKWFKISKEYDYLSPEEWLLSVNSILNLLLEEYQARFVHGNNTKSQFVPEEKCNFKLARGEVLYQRKESDTKSFEQFKGCKIITPNANIEEVPADPKLSDMHNSQKMLIASLDNSLGNYVSVANKQTKGIALFVRYNIKSQETLVGALTNTSAPLVKVSNAQGENSVQLKAGELARVNRDGKVEKLGMFDLRAFYRTSKLTLGLGFEKRDEERVKKEPNKFIQEILLAVREETLKAVEKQSKDTTNKLNNNLSPNSSPNPSSNPSPNPSSSPSPNPSPNPYQPPQLNPYQPPQLNPPSNPLQPILK